MLAATQDAALVDQIRDLRQWHVPSWHPDFRLHRIGKMPFLASTTSLLADFRTQFHYFCYSQSDDALMTDNDAIAAFSELKYQVFESAVSRLAGLQDARCIDALSSVAAIADRNIARRLALSLLVASRPTRQQSGCWESQQRNARLESLFWDWITSYSDGKTRSAGVAALGCLQTVQDEGRIVRLLDDEDFAIVRETIAAIGNLRLVAHFDRIASMLMSNRPGVPTQSALAALFKLKRVRSQEFLVHALKHDTSAGTVSIAIEGLDRLGITCTPRLVAERLATADDYMRNTIVATIATECQRLDYTPCLQYFIPRKRLRECDDLENAMLRCIALGKTKTRVSARILTNTLARHSSAEIRLEAAKSLVATRVPEAHAAIFRHSHVDSSNACHLQKLYCEATNVQAHRKRFLGHLLFKVIGSHELGWIEPLLKYDEFYDSVSDALEKVFARYRLDYHPVDALAGIAPGLMERANESHPFGWSPCEPPSQLPHHFLKSAVAEAHRSARELAFKTKRGRKGHISVTRRPPEFFGSRAFYSPSDEVGASDIRTTLQELLSPDEYNVVMLWAASGETQEHIAVLLGISVRQVGRIVSRAKERLALSDLVH